MSEDEIKYCEDCKNHQRATFSSGEDRSFQWDQCAVVETPTPAASSSPVRRPATGETAPEYCIHVRAEDGPCGPEGKLWEPKPVGDANMFTTHDWAKLGNAPKPEAA